MKTPEFYEKQEIDACLAKIGAWWCAPLTYGYGKSGVPDRIACIDGTLWGIEVKRAGKEPTKLQQARMAAIRKAGGMAVAGTAEVVIKAIQEWRQQRRAIARPRHPQD